VTPHVVSVGAEVCLRHQALSARLPFPRTIIGLNHHDRFVSACNAK